MAGISEAPLATSIVEESGDSVVDSSGVRHTRLSHSPSPDTAAAAAHSNNNKRPAVSRFKQQQLPAWQPILTARTVLPALFVVGAVFVPIGVALLSVSASVRELVIDYTDCNSTSGGDAGGGVTCDSQLNASVNSGDAACVCRVHFQLHERMPAPVYIYYGLTNFYQNHRRYVKSRDDNQLLGRTDASLAECAPFDHTADGVPIAPCGAIANSLFNDSFVLRRHADDTTGSAPVTNNKDDDDDDVVVPLLRTGIAWPSDKHRKFQNPAGSLDESGAFKNTAPPPNWRRAVWQLDPHNPHNNGYENEDLIVWMRTAALPTFRKLWARLNTTDNSAGQVDFSDGLPVGRYSVDIEYRYPVSTFGGSKRLIVSNTSALGGKNVFLGGAYIVVGCVCVLLAVLLLFVHVKYGKRATAATDNITSHTSWSARAQ